ncbi:MAG: amino acid decarboxylase [Candidatus Rokubacteria bacterium]|nr:amino acid decarboxylase [Candidatus Rokubacteria bacterium]
MTTPPAIEPEHFRRLGHAMIDLVTDYLAGMRERPVFRPMPPAERGALMQEVLGEAGASPEAIVERFRTAVMPHAMGNGHPRFFGWVNSPPAPMGVLADLLAAAMNPSCAGGDHAATYVERAAVRWLMELIGFPVEGSMGLLTSGGSVATLIGLAAARHWAATDDGWNIRAEGLQRGRPQFVLYMTEQGHSSIQKAAELLGLGAEAIRNVPEDEHFRMDVPALRKAILTDRAAGKRPFCVTASAGTVGTGAVDPLADLTDLCAAERLWLHVDGAYGAIAAVSAPRERYPGLERVNSLALDPHKWLSIPVECGAVLLRDGRLLREAFSLVPAYLRTEPDRGFGGLPWFSEYGVQQTRGFRALKLWMTLQHLGRDGVRGLVAHHVAMAERLADIVDHASDLERLAPVELSIVCFRYAPTQLRGDEEALNALNKRVMEEVQASGAAFVTQAMLRGRFALRACILHYATTEADIATLVEAVRETGERLAATR